MCENNQIKDKLPIFVSEYNHFCHRNAIRNVLCLSGIKDYDLLIKNSIDLKISPITEKRNIFYPSISNTRPVMNCLENCFSEWTYDIAWDDINNELNKGNLIFLNTDVFYLKYSEYYLKSHGSHVIIIIEEKNNYYYVIDWYAPQYFIGWIYKDELALARKSDNIYEKNHTYSGYPINCAWQVFNSKKIDRNYHKINLMYELLSDISSKQDEQTEEDSKRIKVLFCEIPKLIKYKYISNTQVIEDLFLLIAERKLCIRQLYIFAEEEGEMSKVCKRLGDILYEINIELQNMEYMLLRSDLKNIFIDENKWIKYCTTMLEKKSRFEKLISKKVVRKKNE